jgi:hypothetical protein
MAKLREDNSQPYNNVVTMRYFESLPRAMRGALEYNSEPPCIGPQEHYEQEEQSPYRSL